MTFLSYYDKKIIINCVLGKMYDPNVRRILCV